MENELNIFEQGQALLIDKPLDWTSFDVVRKLRRLVRTKKVGHAGTLDPLATGLLIVCTGKFTKRINEYMAQEKEYTGTVTLGAVTPTYDLESKPVFVGDHGGCDVVAGEGGDRRAVPWRDPAGAADPFGDQGRREKGI